MNDLEQRLIRVADLRKQLVDYKETIAAKRLMWKIENTNILEEQKELGLLLAAEELRLRDVAVAVSENNKGVEMTNKLRDDKEQIMELLNQTMEELSNLIAQVEYVTARELTVAYDKLDEAQKIIRVNC